MGYVELFLIGVGLSMDAFAVSITTGLCCTNLRHTRILWIAVCFGVFQGLMPTAGYFLGKAFEVWISAADHWIALALLGYIGGKMLFDAATETAEEKAYPLTARLLLMQGIATSIDALAVGVSLAALPDVRILPAALLITGVTFSLSLVGTAFGARVGQRLGSRAQLAGGLILIGIGVKIFVEHVFFN